MPTASPTMNRLVQKSVEAPCLVKGLLPVCWVWTGTKNAHGYGRIRHQGRLVGVHQVAYMDLVGEMPSGLEPDHLCKRRDCWNPWHLDPVTHSVNVQRGRAGAVVRERASLVTNCPADHPYTGDNDRRNHLGKRYCRECGKIRDRMASMAAGLGTPNALKTHCPKNHLYDTENTYLRNGVRHCRKCRSEYGRAWRASRPTSQVPPGS